MGVQPINNVVLEVNSSNCALELKESRTNILNTEQQTKQIPTRNCWAFLCLFFHPE